MAVITVSRQYGAGGSLVARLVAERLGWTVIDNEFVGEVAKRAGLPPDEIAAARSGPHRSSSGSPPPSPSPLPRCSRRPPRSRARKPTRSG